MSDEQKAAYRVDKKGGKTKEKLGILGKFSELDKVSIGATSAQSAPIRYLPSNENLRRQSASTLG
jgi:hypothetical protein